MPANKKPFALGDIIKTNMEQVKPFWSEKQKTIFVTSFFGLIGRNILATDFLKIIRSVENLRIVILTPEHKKDFYRQYFGSSNVIVEGVMDRFVSRIDNIFNSIFLNSLDSNSRKIHRLLELKKDKRYSIFLYHLFLSKTVGKSKLFRLWLRWFYFNFIPSLRFSYLFAKYKPDLVFSTDIFDPDDVDLMKEAKKRRVFTVGMIRSWDSITTKGLNKIIPDRLIVSTPGLKEEAACFNDISQEDIHVVGIPHYDNYIKDRKLSRGEVFKKLNLDPTKKVVFFAPPSSIYSKDDPIAEMIVHTLKTLDVQLLLRLYIVGGVNLGQIKPAPNKIAIDDPGGEKNFSRADLILGDAHLVDLLYHSDVVVAFASTLAIDAIVFDKPVVFIGFDVTPKPYWESLCRFYDYDHQRAILRTGGIRLAQNTGELIEFVSMYLSNPKLDEDGRRKVIEERCWKLDGKSSERLADIILKFL